MNFRYKFMQFMSGRYGSDETFFVLVALASVLAIINVFLRSMILQLIVYFIMFLAILRVFSRNVSARRQENVYTKKIIGKVRGYLELRQKRKFDYNHVYKKCPRCKSTLRLPRRKGKHTTVCPRCNHTFKVRVFKENYK